MVRVAQDLEAGAWPILGQERLVATLQRAIAREGVAHAYLFAGPPRSGRGTLARLFAQALNCQSALGGGDLPALAGAATPAVPCGTCRSCRKIERGLHPDVQVVSLASQEAGGSVGGRKDAQHTSLSIDTIRELGPNLSLRPLEGRWRVAIVEDAEAMREDAANAFLKTLEEPPSFAVLILIVPEPGAVLPTIRSRCQVLELAPSSREALALALTARYGVAPAQARTLAALSGGRAGWAIAASGRPEFFAERQVAFAAMLALLQGPVLDLFPFVDRLVERFKRGRRDEVRAELDAWLGLWRDLLLLRCGCDELVLNVDGVAQLRPLAGCYDVAQLREALAATRDATRWLDQNVTPRLALETMVLRWRRDA